MLYLAAARELVPRCWSRVNTDASARQLGKGAGAAVEQRTRPAAGDRGAAERVVRQSCSRKPTPCELIARCRPDVYVKGGDYDMEALEETRAGESWGGRALALPLLAGYSTTALVQRIRGHD